MILEAMRTKQLMSQVLFGSKGDVGFVCPFMHLMIGINIDNWNHGENYRTLRSIFGEDYEKLVLDATREEQFLELKTKALQTFTVKGEELNSRLRMLPGKSKSSSFFVIENWKSPASLSLDSQPLQYSNPVLSYDIGSKCYVQYSTQPEEKQLNRANEEQVSRIKAVLLPSFGQAEKNYGRDVMTKYLGLDGRIADQLVGENLDESEEGDSLLDEKKVVKEKGGQRNSKVAESKLIKADSVQKQETVVATEADSMEMGEEEMYNRWRQATKKKTCSRFGILAFLALACSPPFTSLHFA